MVYKIIFRFISAIEIQYRFLMDRLYAKIWPQRLGRCGNDLHIYYPCFITGPDKMQVGNNVHINRRSLIRAEGGLNIGDNVHIARNVTIYTINHNYEGTAIPYDQSFIKKPVVIEKNVWIGVNVTIIPGVTIGEGAIIGAGSVVSNDVTSLAVVGPAPVRVIKCRNQNRYMKLDKEKLYGGVNGALYGSDKI
jgi:acetyltransferase-like isoleucine patch superfamily enzyme